MKQCFFVNEEKNLEDVQKNKAEIEQLTKERDFRISESIKNQIATLETIFKEKEEFIEGKEKEIKSLKDFKTFEKVATNRSTKPTIGRNPGLTDDIKDQPNVEQCEVVDSNTEKLNDHRRMVHKKGKCEQCGVVVYDREKLKDHIRMVHEKGHRAGKHVPERLLGGQHGREQGRWDRDVRSEEQWQNSRPREI